MAKKPDYSALKAEIKKTIDDSNAELKRIELVEVHEEILKRDEPDWISTPGKYVITATKNLLGDDLVSFCHYRWSSPVVSDTLSEEDVRSLRHYLNTLLGDTE